MPNIASILKAEIARVARKEVRGEIQNLKKAAATHRSEIARLKRRAQALERQLKRLDRGRAAPETGEDEGPHLRFSAKGLASQRRRLGLSAEACGALIGATGQSVYKWESGKARPRARHLPAIAALRKMGRRMAAQRLAELGH
jgi:DNA-binding transcriptional regulator YiaG